MTAPDMPRHAASAAGDALLEPLDRTRRSLRTIDGVRALLLGFSAGAASWILMSLVRALWQRWSDGEVPVAGIVVMVAAMVIGCLTGALLFRRSSSRITRERVALWVEEHVPLDFALVTAADPRAGAAERLAPRLTSVPWSTLVAGAARSRLARPALAGVLCAVAILLVPYAEVTIAGTSAVSAVTSSSGSTVPSRPESGPLSGIEVTVVPPRYSGLPRNTLDDPASIAALVGSVVTIAGNAGESDEQVEAWLGERSLDVAVDDGAWSTSIRMPQQAALVRLGSSGSGRLLLLEPRTDSVPVVRLDAVVVDSVLREPAGEIALQAEARDDLGLASSHWEWIVTTGGGEQFRARSGTLGASSHGGARLAKMQARLDLEALDIGPGDVVHVRAVARDRNDVTGPGVGMSETRTIRIARADEYDSLTIEGVAPPPTDSALLSQRMLLQRTERLVARMAGMERPEVVDSSRSLAMDQATLRRRVGRLVYQKLGEDEDAEHSHFPGDGHDHGAEVRLDPTDILARADAATGTGAPTVLDFEGDETPVVAINQPLLEAYNHMWDAGRALEIADPRAAIPPMQRALEAIQRAREAERYYLRGRPPRIVVDIGAARLEGKESGEGSSREPREAVDPAATIRAARLDAAALLARRDRDAAADSIIVLRLESSGNRELARALDEAARLLRSGEAADAAMATARRLAAPGATRRTALDSWRGW